MRGTWIERFPLVAVATVELRVEGPALLLAEASAAGRTVLAKRQNATVGVTLYVSGRTVFECLARV